MSKIIRTNQLDRFTKKINNSKSKPKMNNKPNKIKDKDEK